MTSKTMSASTMLGFGFAPNSTATLKVKARVTVGRSTSKARNQGKKVNIAIPPKQGDLLTIKGVERTVIEQCEFYKVNYNTYRSRVCHSGYGWVEAMFMVPHQNRGQPNPKYGGKAML